MPKRETPERTGDGARQPPAAGPLTDLVDETLNKSLVDQIAEQLDQEHEAPAPSRTSDYASGTTEHEDEPEA